MGAAVSSHIGRPYTAPPNPQQLSSGVHSPSRTPHIAIAAPLQPSLRHQDVRQHELTIVCHEMYTSTHRHGHIPRFLVRSRVMSSFFFLCTLRGFVAALLCARQRHARVPTANRQQPLHLQRVTGIFANVACDVFCRIFRQAARAMLTHDRTIALQQLESQTSDYVRQYFGSRMLARTRLRVCM